MKCPKCGKEYDRLLALSREDNKTMICDDCGVMEALAAAGFPGNIVRETMEQIRNRSPQERTRAAVYGTGNRWAIENFEATH